MKDYSWQIGQSIIYMQERVKCSDAKLARVMECSVWYLRLYKQGRAQLPASAVGMACNHFNYPINVFFDFPP